MGDIRASLDHSSSFALQTLVFEPCQVSLASYRILKLVHNTIKQACEASSFEMSNVLYQTSRDCLELYIAIIPIKYADSIETVPHMGAVFYNDCCYLAHNTTLITHMYAKELSTSVRAAENHLPSCVGLIDFIPRLRTIGEVSLVIYD